MIHRNSAVVLKPKHMLSSISWHHYLLAVITITSCYYLFVGLKYYRFEIFNLFVRHNHKSPLVPVIASARASVMGEAKADVDISVTDLQELNFAEPLPDEALSLANKQRLDEVDAIKHSPTNELIKEVAALIEASIESDDKEQFLTLLDILIQSYRQNQPGFDLPEAVNRIIELSSGKLNYKITIADFPIALK